MDYPIRLTDSMGNILRAIYENGEEEIYTYDERGNMTSYSYPMGNKYVWTYDEMGNKTTTTYPNGNIWNGSELIIFSKN